MIHNQWYRLEAAGPTIGNRRAALLPSVVRLLLASFLEGVTGPDGTEDEKRAR